MPRYDRITNPENQSLLERITNATNTAEGTVLPPKQVGPTRVAVVSGFRLLRKIINEPLATFTLTWKQPDQQNIMGFRVYYKINENTPISAVTTPAAPVSITVNYTSASDIIVFYIQTVLKNGFVSDINLSPTVSAKFR